MRTVQFRPEAKRRFVTPSATSSLIPSCPALFVTLPSFLVLVALPLQARVDEHEHAYEISEHGTGEDRSGRGECCPCEVGNEPPHDDGADGEQDVANCRRPVPPSQYVGVEEHVDAPTQERTKPANSFPVEVGCLRCRIACELKCCIRDEHQGEQGEDAVLDVDFAFADRVRHTGPPNQDLNLHEAVSDNEHFVITFCFMSLKR